MVKYYKKEPSGAVFRNDGKDWWKRDEHGMWVRGGYSFCNTMSFARYKGLLQEVGNPDHTDRMTATEIKQRQWDQRKVQHYFDTVAGSTTGSFMGSLAPLDYADLELRVAAAYREATSANHTNNESKEMKTYTKATLEQKINPVKPEVQVDVRDSVASLEAANVNAATNIVMINTAQKQEGSTKLVLGYHEVKVTEKYNKRIARLLSDMRKDEEAVLEETSAKLAKVAKVLS